jgi:hypothetical protein
MTMRGWSTVLTVVDEHERLWTVAEAAKFLDEPEDDVRWIIRRLKIEAVGVQKQTGPEKRGRQPRAYRAIDLIRAFDVLSKAA